MLHVCCSFVLSTTTFSPVTHDVVVFSHSLYRAIEDEDWEFVLHFLNKGYWPGNFFYDSTPAADQARTWVTRYEGGVGNGDTDQGVLWSQLPLHLCCIMNAPYEVVSRLLESKIPCFLFCDACDDTEQTQTHFSSILPRATCSLPRCGKIPR